jgi:hypothetical protein
MFNVSTGKFTRYLGDDGTELSYNTNTLPDVTNSNEYMLKSGALMVRTKNPWGALVVAGAATIGSMWLIDNLKDLVSINAPSIPISGFLDVVEEKFEGHGNNKNNPNNHIVYEISGFNTLTSSKETLKYGIADTKYDTYFGYGNSRPTSQLASLRAKYPHMILNYTILSRTKGRMSALGVEAALVTMYMFNHGTVPKEQILPQPMK